MSGRVAALLGFGAIALAAASRQAAQVDGGEQDLDLLPCGRVRHGRALAQRGLVEFVERGQTAEVELAEYGLVEPTPRRCGSRAGAKALRGRR